MRKKSLLFGYFDEQLNGLLIFGFLGLAVIHYWGL